MEWHKGDPQGRKDPQRRATSICVMLSGESPVPVGAEKQTSKLRDKSKESSDGHGGQVLPRTKNNIKRENMTHASYAEFPTNFIGRTTPWSPPGPSPAAEES